MSLDQKYLVFQNEVTQYERQIAEKKRIKQGISDLEKEREFYYSITRRRAPWDLILKELSKLTPKGLWIERFSAAKNNLVMIGKAEKVNEVSAFAVNLSHSSKYFSDVLLSGSRDYSDGLVYKEFQITARLKAPEGVVLPISSIE
jgi:Tfp pilus assembly protein PilN